MKSKKSAHYFDCFFLHKKDETKNQKERETKTIERKELNGMSTIAGKYICQLTLVDVSDLLVNMIFCFINACLKFDAEHLNAVNCTR